MNSYPVGPGWWPLLEEMEKKIRTLDPEVQLLYKEKYGTLQVNYITESPEHFHEIDRLTREAEKASETICESCGQPGRLREQNRWFAARCDRCAEQL